jgi:hypothetical protein
MELLIRTMPQWRLWFWWRDWKQSTMSGMVKQRYWKWQIGPVQFCFWHRRGGC